MRENMLRDKKIHLSFHDEFVIAQVVLLNLFYPMRTENHTNQDVFS